jgi:hypothetical protein
MLDLGCQFSLFEALPSSLFLPSLDQGHSTFHLK